MSRDMDWETTAKTIIFSIVTIAIAALIGVALVVFVPRPGWSAWDKVAGEWEQYRLNESQMNWFRTVRSKNGIPCCDFADGHPTLMERREDGIYIPNPNNPAVWIRVPDAALTTPGTNPVGVATVWYTNNGAPEPYIRCFVPESET